MGVEDYVKKEQENKQLIIRILMLCTLLSVVTGTGIIVTGMKFFSLFLH